MEFSKKDLLAFNNFQEWTDFYITGKMLQKIRLLKDVPQKIIACRLKITQQCYSKFEKSERIDREKLSKILNALNSSIAEVENIQKFIATLNRSN